LAHETLLFAHVGEAFEVALEGGYGYATLLELLLKRLNFFGQLFHGVFFIEG
jgi:hypothetical protein